MIAMLTLSAVLAGTAWQVRKSHPLSARIAGGALALYGLLYHLLLVGVMSGSVASADVGRYAESIGVLLMIPVISMAVYFRMQLKANPERKTQ